MLRLNQQIRTESEIRLSDWSVAKHRTQLRDFAFAALTISVTGFPSYLYRG
jgi:hypothetical protein